MLSVSIGDGSSTCIVENLSLTPPLKKMSNYNQIKWGR